jgi:hypothetical protein
VGIRWVFIGFVTLSFYGFYLERLTNVFLSDWPSWLDCGVEAGCYVAKQVNGWISAENFEWKDSHAESRGSGIFLVTSLILYLC